MNITIYAILLRGGHHKAVFSGICVLQRATAASKEQMYRRSIYGNFNIEFHDLLIKLTMECEQFTVKFQS